MTFETTAQRNDLVITIYRDGEDWIDSGRDIALYQNGSLSYQFGRKIASDSTVTFQAIHNGTYDIYAYRAEQPNGTIDQTYYNTGKRITILDDSANEGINYYTITKNEGFNTELTIKLDDINGNEVLTSPILV